MSILSPKQICVAKDKAVFKDFTKQVCKKFFETGKSSKLSPGFYGISNTMKLSVTFRTM